MSTRVNFKADIKKATQDDYDLFQVLESRFNRHTDLMKYLLECARKVENEKTTRAGNDTINYIDTIVKRQMELNQSTTKTYIVGSGKTEKSVKYEQRSITDKWIMDLSLEERSANIEGAVSVSRKLALEYIDMHKAELDAHHEWLCKQAGKDFNDDNVRNFNRTTGKAQAAAEKMGS